MKTLFANFYALYKRIVLRTMLAAVCTGVVFPAWAQSSEPTGPYAYIAQNEPLESVLKGLCNSFGLKPNLSGLPSVSLSGKFSGKNFAEVLNDLSRQYDFGWFLHGRKLYTYRSNDWTSERVSVSPSLSGNVKEHLSAYGLANAKFSVIDVPGSETVLISGPRVYVDLVATTVRSERSKGDSDLLVYRLKYASVEDRTVTLRDKQVNTPGVATILKNILQGANRGRNYNAQPQTVAGYAGVNGQGMGAPIEPMQGLAREPGSGSGIAPQDSSDPNSGRPGAQIGPVVQGDPRTNSIIIRDKASRYEHYKALIDQLDVPLSMIEVEAVVIDIDQKKFQELGAEFSINDKRLKYDFGNPVLDSSGSSTSVINDGVRFAARIRALTTENKARVVAKPTILTLDNLSAVIDLSQTFYTRVTGERVANVVPVTAGSILRVSPRIVNREPVAEIQMQVDIEDGALKDRVGVDLPTVQKSAISTQASIRESQSILIGGYNRDVDESGEQRVPGLGSLPLIGGLFTVKTKNSERVTRMFLLTPRVITQKIAVGDLSERNSKLVLNQKN